MATYASEAWAPLGAEADCLGSGDDDIDREGRWVGAGQLLHFQPSCLCQLACVGRLGSGRHNQHALQWHPAAWFPHLLPAGSW